MKGLPQDIIGHIFQFDRTFHDYYSAVIHQIKMRVLVEHIKTYSACVWLTNWDYVDDNVTSILQYMKYIKDDPYIVISDEDIIENEILNNEYFTNYCTGNIDDYDD